MEFLMRVFLFVTALMLGCSLFGAGIEYKKAEGAVTVKHPQFNCVVSAAGGQLTSFITKCNNRELVNPTSPQIDGMGKVKDGLFSDITPQLAIYDLAVERKSSELVLVRVSWLCNKAVFKGVKFVRTFVFDSNKNYVTIQESLEAVNAVAELYVEFHNSVSAENFSKNTFFTARGADGDVKFDIKTLNMQNTQSIHDPAVPWFGYIDSAAGNGLALLFDNPKQISCFFAWKNNQHLVMAAKFRKIKIEPVAAAEFWRTEYALIPLQGRGTLLHTGKEMVISGKKSGDKFALSVYLPEKTEQGKIEICSAGKVIAGKAVKSDSSLYNFNVSVDAADIQVCLKSKQGSSAVKLAGKPAVKKYAKANRRLPAMDSSLGVQGNYYYYTDMYLTEKYPAWVSFGINGDFRRKKDLRLGLVLPPEVKVLANGPDRFRCLKKSDIMLDNVPMVRYEYEVFRNKSYYNCMEFCLQINGKLKKGAFGAVQAIWKGGEQKPFKFNLCQIENFPELKAPLKYFTLGMEYRRDTKLFPIEKFGYNSIMIPRWESDYSKYRGEGFYKEMIEDLNKRGIRESQSFLGPFRIMDIVAGNGVARKEAEELFHPVVHKQKVDFSVLNARDINDSIAIDIKNRKLACPAMVSQGNYMKKTLDIFKTAIDYGYNNFCVDEEHWTNGATVCFCKNCNAEYEKRVKAAGLPAVDMKVVARDGGDKYVKHYDIWWDMKTDQIAEIYRQIRELIDTYRPLPNGKKRTLMLWIDERVDLNNKYYSAITNRLTDHRKLAKYADELLPMCYEADSRRVITTAQRCSKLIEGCRAKTVMGLSPNRTYEYHRVLSGDLADLKAFEQQILESYFNGAKGVTIWSLTAGFRGAYDFVNTINAVNRMLPIEEIVFCGKPVKVDVDNPSVLVTALEFKGKVAVFLREYSNKDITVNFKMPGKCTSATDTLTGKVLTGQQLKFSGDNRLHTLLLQ